MQPSARGLASAATLLLAASLARAAPAFDLNTYEQSNNVGVFVQAASTTNILNPAIRISATDAVGLRTGFAPHAISSRTVAMWRFDGLTDEILADSVGQHHAALQCVSGTCAVSATLATSAFDVFQKTLLINATEQLAIVADDGNAVGDAELDPTSEFTIEAWVQVSQLPTLAFATVLEKAPDIYGLYVQTDGRVTFKTTGSSGEKILHSSAAVFPSNAFLHVAAVYSISRNEKSLWVEGVLRASTTADSGTLTPSTGRFSFGVNPDDPDEGLLSSIDDVRLSAFALRDYEIEADHFSGGMRFSKTGAGSWSRSAGQVGVTIEPSSDIPPTSATFQHTGLPAFANCSTLNYAQFVVGNAIGETTLSDALRVTVSTTRPVTPSPVAQAVSTGSLTFDWSPDPCGATYSVRVSTAGAPAVFHSTATTPVFSIGGLSPDSQYGIRVLALSSTGQAALTPIISTYTLARAPTGATILAVSSESARLTWWPDGNPSDTRYELWYGLAGGSTRTTTVALTTATLTGLTTGQAQFFKVRALNKVGLASTFDVGLGSTTLSGFLANAPASPDQRVVISGVLNAPGRSFTLEALPGTFDRPFTLDARDANTGNPCGLAANAVQITVNPAMQPKRALSLSIGYTAAELSAGGLDPARPDLLILSRYDDTAARCVPLVTQGDAAARTLSAKLNHLSIFQIQQAPAAPQGLSGVRVFPNPLFASQASQAYFTVLGLPSGTEVRVYSLKGELLSETSANPSGQARWDAVNQAGEPVGSGVYLLHVRVGDEDRTLKLAVER